MAKEYNEKKPRRRSVLAHLGLARVQVIKRIFN